MGLRTAAVTRLAAEDRHVVEEMAHLGVEIFVKITRQSTCLRLEYPTSNVDERTIFVTSTAGSFTPEELAGIQARLFVLGASFRGEIGLDVVQTLAAKGVRIALDAQGYVRVVRDGRLVFEEWPEQQDVLAHVHVLKADAVEAGKLTGQQDIRLAASLLAELGPEEVLITHRDGLLVLAQGHFYEAGFFPLALVGRSGRGDTCLAAYASRRLSASPAQATVWAAAVTSLKMEAEGPFRRGLREVEDLIRQRYGGTAAG
jgi:sugar/nucleoside kinase (ribokinase family)